MKRPVFSIHLNYNVIVKGDKLQIFASFILEFISYRSTRKYTKKCRHGTVYSCVFDVHMSSYVRLTVSLNLCAVLLLCLIHKLSILDIFIFLVNILVRGNPVTSLETFLTTSYEIK
jgi:hypothetical protein